MSMKTLAFAAALACAPIAASAITIDVNGVEQVPTVSGTTFSVGTVPFVPILDPSDFRSTVEIFGNDTDGAGTVIITYAPSPSIKNLAVTSSLNANPLAPSTLGQGFLGAVVDIRIGTDADNDGLLDTLVATMVQPDVSGGTPLIFNPRIEQGSLFQIVAQFSDVVGNGQNLDLRVQAVPLPAPLALLAVGIGGIGLLGRRRR